MKIISATSKSLIMEPSKKENGWKAFVFDIGIVPLKPTPKKIVITQKIGAYTHTWSMPWRRFLKAGCVDTIVILDKSLMSHTFMRTR